MAALATYLTTAGPAEQFLVWAALASSTEWRGLTIKMVKIRLTQFNS